MGTGAWPSPPYSPPVWTPPELHGALVSGVSSWLSLPHCAGAGTPPDPPSDPILDAGLMLPEVADAGTVTQVRARSRGWGKPGWPLAGGWHGTGHSLSGGLGAPLRQCGTGVGVTAAWSGIGNGDLIPFPLQRVHVGCSVPSPVPVLPSATLLCVCRTPTSCQRPEARLLQVPERVPSWRVGSASPYPCCPDIPALPCSPALAGHHLTHTLSPAGPLRRSRLSPGGSAAATAPGLTGANPSSSEPEPRSARTPVTWRAQGTRAPPRTAGRWGGRGAS